jgi:hypothetical protein
MRSIILILVIISLNGCTDDNHKNKINKTSQYVMEVCGNEKINNPDYKSISTSLSKIINGLCKNNPFLIISQTRNENIYVQIAYLEEVNNFTVEYQDGSIDKHFQSARNFNAAEILNLLVEYSISSKRWDSNIQWQRIQIK